VPIGLSQGGCPFLPTRVKYYHSRRWYLMFLLSCSLAISMLSVIWGNMRSEHPSDVTLQDFISALCLSRVPAGYYEPTLFRKEAGRRTEKPQNSGPF
jgi:hypothetical protein